MLFKTKKQLKGIESFNPQKCKLENKKSVEFNNDNVAMGCSEGCWSSCIGTCKINNH